MACTCTCACKYCHNDGRSKRMEFCCIKNLYVTRCVVCVFCMLRDGSVLVSQAIRNATQRGEMEREAERGEEQGSAPAHSYTRPSTRFRFWLVGRRIVREMNDVRLLGPDEWGLASRLTCDRGERLNHIQKISIYPALSSSSSHPLDTVRLCLVKQFLWWRFK